MARAKKILSENSYGGDGNAALWRFWVRNPGEADRKVTISGRRRISSAKRIGERFHEAIDTAGTRRVKFPP
jgi:hypothetical protein